MSSFATRVVRIIRLDAPELSGMGQVSQDMQLFMYMRFFGSQGLYIQLKIFFKSCFYHFLIVVLSFLIIFW